MLDNLLELEKKVDPFFADMQKSIIDDFKKKGLKVTGPTSPAEQEKVV